MTPEQKDLLKSIISQMSALLNDIEGENKSISDLESYRKLADAETNLRQVARSQGISVIDIK